MAGYYQEKVSNLRLVEVIEYVFSYGLVLENKGLWLEPNIRAYIRNNKEKLFQIMSSTMKPLKVRSFASRLDIAKYIGSIWRELQAVFHGKTDNSDVLS